MESSPTFSNIDGELLNFVPGSQLLHYICTTNDLAENGVEAIHIRSLSKRNVKLAAARSSLWVQGAAFAAGSIRLARHAEGSESMVTAAKLGW